MRSVVPHGWCASVADQVDRAALRISTKDVQDLLEREGLSVKDEDLAVYRAVFDGVDTCAQELMSMQGVQSSTCPGQDI